jgi:hypothetical protein
MKISDFHVRKGLPVLFYGLSMGNKYDSGERVLVLLILDMRM